MYRLPLILLATALTACSTMETRYGTSQTVPGDADYPAQLFSNTEESEPAATVNEEIAAVEVDITPAPPTDVWQRIRDGFTLEDSDHPRLQRQLDWYVRHPAYMQRVSERATPYMYHVIEIVEENEIPSELALLPIVESAFQPFAYSHGRAAGIWQFIPSTGRLYGLQQNWWYDGRRDVYASTDAAVALLKDLSRQFDGDWMLALAAYNSGPGTVRKAIRRNKKRGKPTDFWSLKLPRETRAYVPKLLALKKLIADPAAYNLDLPAIPNKPYLAQVELSSQIDLARAAELADISLDELYRLNPGYNRWATAPDGPHHLLIPLDSVDFFAENLKALPPEQRIRWVRHRIKSGETLSTIAVRYNTSMSTIKQVNRIRGTHLRAGHSLTIPVASRSASSYRLSAAQRKKSLQNQPRKGVKVVHIVQSGDTFWDLAQRHKVNVRSLAKWNGMAPRDPLAPGQKLVIWSRSGIDTSSLQAAVLALPQQRTVTKRIGYKVRRGDSLAKISRKFRVSVAQLKRWNNLPEGKYLQPGQRLTLYVDVMKTSS
jgi:membrane-bound lytic murein transglycosylase D